jgi:hypothetical protein
MKLGRTAFASSIALAAALLCCISTACGDMLGSKSFVLDFTKAEEARQKATWAESFSLAGQGLGFSGPKTTMRDLRVETTEPLGIGWSWRPVTSVRITARIEPPGQFQFGETSITFPSGSVFARYSPLGKHWSSWQYLEIQRPEDRSRPEQVYCGTLCVPRKEREWYERLLREYSRMDVPWPSDEEAAVRWILARDPECFTRSLPFIGYLQFLFETRLHGGRKIQRIHVTMSYGAGGMHTPPRDRSVYETRQGPWRLKAE